LAQIKSLEIDSLGVNRPIVSAALALGATLCLGATLMVMALRGPVGWGSWSWIAASFGMAGLTRMVTSHPALLVSGSLGAAAIAGALGVLSTYSEDPSRWFLSDGLVITMTMAFLYHGFLEYFVGSAMVWGVLAVVVPLNVHGAIDDSYLLMTWLGSMIVGGVISSLFHAVRTENFELREQLRHLALHDELTGLPNRRSFLSQYDALAARTEGDGLYLFMVDIDFFKRFNDDFGHDAGDLALQTVARVLEQEAGDLCTARLGGEEFALMGRLTDSQALAQAARLNQAVAACSVRERGITVSIGLARRQQEESCSSLMRRADIGLYRAKTGGRDRYCVVGDDGGELMLPPERRALRAH
jgi:diguanylate cyclase (GGDEF)-like protein